MTVVLLHGLGGDRQQPLSLLAPVVADDPVLSSRPVIAPDVRAHGASRILGSGEAFALDALAEEVAAEVLAATPAHPATDPVTLLGISMGAAIALRIVTRGLLPVDRAVFIRPAFGATPLPESLAVFPVIAQLLEDHGAEGGLRLFRRSALRRRIRELSPAAATALDGQFRSPEAATRRRRLVEIPRDTALRDPAELRAVRIPVLVVAALRDPVHPVRIAEQWAAALPASSLVHVPARDDGTRVQTAVLRDRVARWLASTS